MSTYRESSRRRTSASEEHRSSRTASAYRSTGTRSTSGRSTRSTGSGNRGRRRRKRKTDVTQILMIVIGILILILAISLAVRACGKMKPAAGDAASTESALESSSEGTEEGQVTVDGVNIAGMSQEEAHAAILASYNWSMKVTYQDKEAAVSNLMESKLDDLLEEIYATELKPGESYEVNTDNLTEAAQAEAALISGQWEMTAKNGGISGYDKDSGKFTFTEGSNGLVIDQETLAARIVEAVQKKEYDAVIEAEVKEVSPELTAAQLQEKYKTIGTYTTKTTSNSNRNENIRLACNALNGTIVNPGQEFSFNDTTGARTEAKGYKPATAYLNGEVVQEPGGGVCQVSSTLYNAVIFSGLKTKERKAHSYEPSYVTPGEDAAVSYGGPDFKFVNTSDYPIAIKTSFANQELTISIYGVPVLPEGTKIRMYSEKVGTIDPPAPVYEEDPYFPLDQEEVVKEGVPGTSWTTYLVTYVDGTETSREFFHTSTYRGKSATIKRNTSGTVLSSEGETEDPLLTSTDVSESAAETQAGPGAEGPGAETSAAGETQDTQESAAVSETSEVIVQPANPDSSQGNSIPSPGSQGIQMPGGTTTIVSPGGPGT